MRLRLSVIRNVSSDTLKANWNQVETRAWGAKEFLEERLTIEELSSLFPEEPDLMPELPAVVESPPPAFA